MTDVIIKGLPSLNNFGTAMMGLVVIQALADRVPGPLRVFADLWPETDIDEIFAELNVDRARVSISRHAPPPRPRLASAAGLALRLRELAGAADTRIGDLFVVLGGDDLSEYYDNRTWRLLRGFWLTNRATPTILLCQTIGPFNQPRNRLAARFLMPALQVVTRDRWTTSYLETEFGLRKRVRQGTDLAWSDLPLQHRRDLEAEVLARFGLAPDSYATVVVSAMQKGGYYTQDRALYLQSWAQAVEQLLALPEMAGRQICLLAHTFGPIYGDEGQNVRDVFGLLPPAVQARVVPVPDRLLPTRARFVLGNGLFTITGRMHPAVSTFQMGKPAISLAYSKKYEGVIGSMIGRSDLIIEANDPALWSSGAIVSTVVDRARDVLNRHDPLCAQIRDAVARQKLMLTDSLDTMTGLIRGH